MIGPKLESPPVVLAPFLAADITQSYLAWLRDDAVTRFTEIARPPESLEAAAAYVEEQARSEGVLFWRILLDGEHVGNLRASGLSGAHQRAAIALIIGERRARGKGVGTAAISLATDHLFSLGIHKVTAGMYELNQASKAAFLKAGFGVEAVLKDHYRCDGQFTDGVLVARINPLHAL